MSVNVNINVPGLIGLVLSLIGIYYHDPYYLLPGMFFVTLMVVTDFSKEVMKHEVEKGS